MSASIGKSGNIGKCIGLIILGNVLFATMLVKSNKSINFPFQISQIMLIKGQVDYTHLNLQNGILYHRPSTKNIDALLFSNNTIEVFQIQKVKIQKVKAQKAKVNNFCEELQLIRKITGKKVHGWFIFIFDMDIDIPENITAIQGTDRIKIM